MKGEAFIIYVENPARSRYFYEKILGLKVRLDAGNYVEFDFNGAGLGLMPKKSIKEFPASTQAPCELHFLTDKIGEIMNKLLQAEAEMVSPLEMRPWGGEAAYFKDPDGYIIALGRRISAPAPCVPSASPKGEPAVPIHISSDRETFQFEGVKFKMVKVIKEYKAAYPEAIKISKGEKLKTLKKKSEWSGWIWCVNSAKKGGWVPASILQIEGRTATALKDYDASELSAREGEELMALEQESGWCWCANEKGKRGWIPLNNIRFSAK